MRNGLLACVLLAGVSSAAWAQQAKGLGVGVLVGDTVGATGKYWFDTVRAVDFAAGVDSNRNDLVVSGDYLYHGWKALPQPKTGKLAAYVGGGPRLEARTKTEFGLRGVGGIDYWLPRYPLECFAELGPFWRMAPTGGVYAIGGIGARFYFAGHWN